MYAADPRGFSLAFAKMEQRVRYGVALDFGDAEAGEPADGILSLGGWHCPLRARLWLPDIMPVTAIFAGEVLDINRFVLHCTNSAKSRQHKAKEMHFARLRGISPPTLLGWVDCLSIS